MLVDAETLSQRPVSADVIPRVAGRARAREARALRVDRRAEQRRVRVAGRGARRPALAAPCDGRRRARDRLHDRGRRLASDRHRERAEDRRRAALPRLRRVRRPDRAAAGRSGAARPRRHARCRDVPARHGAPDSVAAGRARALCELPVVRGRAHGPAVHARRDPRPAAATRRAAAVRVVVRLGAARRALRRLRRRRPTTADPLGHSPASEVRHARGAHARSADGRRAHRRVRSPDPCARALGPRAGAAGPAAGDRAVFHQNRWAASRFGPRAGLIHPERDGEAVRATDLYAELVERTVPALAA